MRQPPTPVRTVQVVELCDLIANIDLKKTIDNLKTMKRHVLNKSKNAATNGSKSNLRSKGSSSSVSMK